MKKNNILGVFLLSILFISTSCNIEKRVEKNEKAFDNIGKRWLGLHPCANDSSYIYIEGKRDSIPFLIPVLVKDTIEIRKQIDSLNIYLERKYNKQRADCANQVRESYNAGYQKAESVWKDKLSKIKIPLPVIDTIKITLKDRQQIKLLNDDLNESQKQLADIKVKLEKYQGKTDKWFLLFIIACCLLLTSIYFNIKSHAR